MATKAIESTAVNMTAAVILIVWSESFFSPADRPEQV